MAVTIRASNKGLEEVDHARRKKGWAKSAKVWADVAITSVATLRRFWAGLPIQAETFCSICEAVGITDWESIADFEINELPGKGYTKRLVFALAGSIEEIDKDKLDAIVALLQKLGGDTTIKILDIDEGSIKLILGGSEEALEKIESLFKSGELTNISSISVQEVHFLKKTELVLLIRKNSGNSLNLSGVDLSGTELRDADLRGADLRGAVLRGADLSDANLSSAVLSDAFLPGPVLSRAVLSRAVLRRAVLRRAVLHGVDLSGTDLSGAIMSDAVLRGADLSGAIMSDAVLHGVDLSDAVLRGAMFRNNWGLTELDKADMQKRGAIFQDSPDSDVPSYVRP